MCKISGKLTPLPPLTEESPYAHDVRKSQRTRVTQRIYRPSECPPSPSVDSARLWQA